MNKHMRLPVDIQLVRHPGQVVLSLLFRRQALEDWCIGLCLLNEGLIETLTITGERPTTRLKIRVIAKPEIGSVARLNFKPDTSQLEITGASLGYLQHFFLKYYRDGVAEVDHIDLEAIDGETGNKDIYITFRVPDSRPTVSPEEAERRLRG
jgi:hypothetical protein